MQEAYIVAGYRTAVGKAKRGGFRFYRPDDLAVDVISGLMASVPQLEAKRVDDVIVGNAVPEAEQGLQVGRIIAARALGFDIPGMTVNRYCASGLESIAMATAKIRSGMAECIIAGGTESMSMVPMGGNKPSFSPAIFDRDENIAIAYGMGITAEKVAQQWKISREHQDLFAAESHRRALHAADTGEFKDEITPYQVVERTPDLTSRDITVKQRTVVADEGPRRDTSPEGLARLKPVFAAKGSVTAGNSSQTSDGAGAVVLMSEAAMKRFNLLPLGRFMAYAVAGVPPEIMGIGPVRAIPKALQLAGVKLGDVDWIELNEAFAAQSLAVLGELGIDRAKVNPLGGAIALGHPLGATGAVRTATLMHGMRRHKKKYGMVTMCIGTGMGAAGLFESL